MSLLRTGTYLTPGIPVDFFEAILQYLEANLHLHSTLLYDSRRHGPNLEIEDPFDSGYLDLAWMTSSSYLNLLENECQVTLLPIKSVHKHELGEGCYTDIIIHKDLKEVTKDFLDLRGYGFAFDVPNSLSGEIITRLNLRNLGENQSFFKGVLYSGSHLESIKAVIAKKVEAAAVDANCLSFFLNRNPHLNDDIEVLTSWGTLPPYAWVVRSSLSDKFMSDITNCLYDMHKSEDGQKILSNFAFNVSGFKPAKHDDFQKAADMEKQFKGAVSSNAYY